MKEYLYKNIGNETKKGLGPRKVGWLKKRIENDDDMILLKEKEANEEFKKNKLKESD